MIPGLGLPDIMEHFSGFRLGQFGQTVEDVHGFMLPAALLAGAWEYLFQSRPEPHGTVPYGQFRGVQAA